MNDNREPVTEEKPKKKRQFKGWKDEATKKKMQDNFRTNCLTKRLDNCKKAKEKKKKPAVEEAEDYEELVLSKVPRNEAPKRQYVEQEDDSALLAKEMKAMKLLLGKVVNQIQEPKVEKVPEAPKPQPVVAQKPIMRGPSETPMMRALRSQMFTKPKH